MQKFDDEFGDLSGYKILSFEEMSKGFEGNKNPLQGISRKSFEEKSNEYALQSPLGKNSVFYKPKISDFDPLTTEFYNGGVNYELLANDLRNNLGKINEFVFDYQKYKINDIVQSDTLNTGEPISYNIKRSNPFLFKENEILINAVFDESKLNIRKSILSNDDPKYNISFNEKNVTYSFIVLYKDGEGKEDEIENTKSLTDKEISIQYFAIDLNTTNANILIEFCRKIRDDSFANNLKLNIIRHFGYFFEEAKNNADKLDTLYEKRPDFVLEQRADEDLWKDFVTLSESGIDTIGTNENLSVINLLKGVKNSNWWYNQINNNPEPTRKVFEKFSSKHIDELITSFSRIGLKNWKNKELEKAWKFDIDYKEYKPSDGTNDPYLRYTGFAYYLEKDKKYRVGTALFGYEYSSDAAPYNEKEIGNKIEMPFSPMKMVLEGGKELYIPCFVAEYFTNKKIDEEWWIVLNNIAAGLLPEINETAFKNLLNLNSKLRYSKYVKILGENPAFQKILVELSETRYMAKYLSLEEEAVLRFYTTNPGYKNFNQALRGEIAMTEEFKIQKELMNKALDKLPKYQSNEMLYRIENLSEDQINKIYKVGNTIENKHFTSSTYDYKALREAVLNRPFTVIVRIKGKNGKLIEELSTLQTEREILFRSNTKFRVEKIGNTINPIDPDDFTNYVKEITLIEK